MSEAQEISSKVKLSKRVSKMKINPEEENSEIQEIGYDEFTAAMMKIEHL